MQQIVLTPIAAAVAPLRERAIKAAEIRHREYLEKIQKTLADNDFDITKVAPYPHTGLGRKAYIAAKERHNFFTMMTNYDEVRTGIRKNMFFSSHYEVHYVTWDTEAAERSIVRAKEDAAVSYDAYVVKLEEKVGAHVTAVLRPLGDLWSYSFVDVTLPDDTIQAWKTQMIINHSSLGRLFNQWPTRIVNA